MVTANFYKYDIWKSKCLSAQNLVYASSGDVISQLIKPAYVALNKKDEYFLQKDSKVITSGSIVNIYIAYKLPLKSISSNNALKNCLFGATKVTKPDDTTDPDKYIYSGYGLGFDSRGQFTHPLGGMARNIIIFGADSSNSAHATNKTQNILILCHGLTQEVNNTTVYAEKMHSPNFSAENKAFCLSLNYNGDDSYLFVNCKKATKFKAKDSEIKANQLALGSISTSTNLSNSDIEDSKLYVNVYDFSVDYSAITNDEILHIQNYLMKRII